MKLDCGETFEAKEERLMQWHPFFAFLPRRIGVRDGRKICAWLEVIERRATGSYYNWPFEGFIWEYRERQK